MGDSIFDYDSDEAYRAKLALDVHRMLQTLADGQDVPTDALRTEARRLAEYVDLIPQMRKRKLMTGSERLCDELTHLVRSTVVARGGITCPQAELLRLLEQFRDKAVHATLYDCNPSVE